MTTESAGISILTIRVFSHPAGTPRPFTLVVNTEDGTASMFIWYVYFVKYCLCTTTAVVDGDYVPVIGQIIQFNAGDVSQTHTVLVNDDDECEEDPNEIFFTNIVLDSGISDITVTVPQAFVTINDSDVFECGKYRVSSNNAPLSGSFQNILRLAMSFPCTLLLRE